MNYKKLYNEISAWKGVEKEYWKAVEILEREQKLTADEIKACKNGLTCHTGDLVTHKLKELADFCKSKIPEKASKNAEKQTSQNDKTSKD